MKDIIIHYVYRKNNEWVIAYEIRGEWRPQNAPLKELIEQGLY